LFLYKEKLTLLFVLFCLVFKDQCPTLALAKKGVPFRRVPYKITNIMRISQEIVKKIFLYISTTFSKI
jgi:hypothetical protein